MFAIAVPCTAAARATGASHQGALACTQAPEACGLVEAIPLCAVLGLGVICEHRRRHDLDVDAADHGLVDART